MSRAGELRLRARIAAILMAVLGLMLFSQMASATASAAGSITEFSSGLPQYNHWADNLGDITAGPDGNLWFTDPGAVAIGKITPSGAITEYSTGLGPHSLPQQIVAGPDGDLWFTDDPEEEGTPAIGRITPSGAITEFSTGVNQEGHAISVSRPESIVAGPDGNVWFTDDAPFLSPEPAAIGKITPSGSITEYEQGSVEQSSGCFRNPADITVGPDGNLWFTNYGSDFGIGCGGIGKITPGGAITEYETTHDSGIEHPQSLTTGPDGNLWFTSRHGIGRITTSGSITSFTTGLLPNPNLGKIIAGPDGNLWFSDSERVEESAAVGRITPSGTITMFRLPDPADNRIGDLVAGPDGNVWFTDYNNESEPGSSAVGRISPSGQVTMFTLGLAARSRPTSLTIGPSDTNVWFTDTDWTTHSTAAVIGRLGAVAAPNTSPNPALVTRVIGEGSIGITPGGMTCGTSCETPLPSGTAVSLTATPDPGYRFAGWNEDCEFEFCDSWTQRESQFACQEASPCTVTLHGDTEVSALFAPATPEEAGGSGGGSSGGGVGSSSTVPSAPSPSPVQAKPTTKPKPKPSQCRKGFKKKTVHGKQKCVKVKAGGKHHGHKAKRLSLTLARDSDPLAINAVADATRSALHSDGDPNAVASTGPNLQDCKQTALDMPTLVEADMFHPGKIHQATGITFAYKSVASECGRRWRRQSDMLTQIENPIHHNRWMNTLGEPFFVPLLFHANNSAGEAGPSISATGHDPRAYDRCIKTADGGRRRQRARVVIRNRVIDPSNGAIEGQAFGAWPITIHGGC